MARALKRIGLVVIILIAVGFLYRLIFVYRFRPGDCDTGPQRPHGTPVYPKRLVVMTYNISGHSELLDPEHIDKIAAAINEVRPDVVGLNEVHKRTWQSRFDDQAARLQRLTHMNGVFGRSYNELGGGFGNAMLTRGTIVRSDVRDLPASGEPRSLLDVQLRLDGMPLEVFVLHTAAWASLNSSIRGRQLACAASRIRSSQWAHVVMGDFNAPPDAAEIRAFRRETPGLQLCGENIGPTQKTLNERIDYIFADSGWRVASVRVLDIGPSDHRPVVAELVHE